MTRREKLFAGGGGLAVAIVLVVAFMVRPGRDLGLDALRADVARVEAHADSTHRRWAALHAEAVRQAAASDSALQVEREARREAEAHARAVSALLGATREATDDALDGDDSGAELAVQAERERTDSLIADLRAELAAADSTNAVLVARAAMQDSLADAADAEISAASQLAEAVRRENAALRERTDQLRRQRDGWMLGTGVMAGVALAGWIEALK